MICVWAKIMKLLLFITSFLFSSFLFQDAGIWFVFHSSSTGDSHGLVPETKAELTPLGIFYNNRVHSNFKVSAVLLILKLILDNCSWVKSVCALSLISVQKNKPHCSSLRPKEIQCLKLVKRDCT